MFKGFTQQRGFNGFTRNLYGARQTDWNGIPVQFWLDAGSGLALSGSLVDSWTDRVFGIRHIPSAPSQRGTLTASDPNFNFNPSVSASSASLRAEVGKGSTLQMGRGYTIATVHAVPAGIGGRVDVMSGSPNWSPNLAIGGTRAQHLGLGICVNGDSVGLGTSYETTAPTIAVWTPERIFANGIERAITTGPASFLISCFGVYDWVGGGGAGGLTQLAEILCFPFEATPAECLQISDLLNGKYAIY